MKPICIPCKRFFRVKKVGQLFTEMMPGPGEKRPKPGTEEPEKWTPYKVWSGDYWVCEGCGATIISGVGQSAISEHFEEDFSDWQNRAKEFVVNDC